MNWLTNIFNRKAKVATPDKPVQYRIVQPAFEQWNGDDVSHLRSFFGSGTGQKLIAICGSETFQIAMKEANGDSTVPQAAGMDSMLRFQFNLASDAMLKKISEATPDAVANPESSEQNDAELLLRSF